MKQQLKTIAVILLSLVAVGVAAEMTSEEDAALLLGQGDDGNLSTPVHVIELFDDQGRPIRADDKSPPPFSLRQTCGQCHDYDLIAKGWHFNGHNSAVEPGRPGQPWVLTDSTTRTQIPMTAREWAGTFSPQQLGVTPWEFVKMHFSHFPGGSYGEMELEDPEEAIRQTISGTYEINCLACHNADPRQNQSDAALQAARQNYRWIAAGSSGMAEIRGVASELDSFFDPEFDEGITLKYKDGTFNDDDTVFFDITKHPSNGRCYFCHSNQRLTVSEDRAWTEDEDVHLTSGLQCVDCHRNGDDHMITRGTGQREDGASLTCEGCHVGDLDTDKPERGRLGAPKPAHRGIPTVHFEKLTCTACHSGPWPDDQAERWRTARIHKTGLHGRHNLNLLQPHVYAPVMMRGIDGKIGPYKVFWPAYWAMIENGTPVPIAPKAMPKAAADILRTSVDTVDDWKPLTAEQIIAVLKSLDSEDKKAAYIAGGRVYQLTAEDTLAISEDPVASPYAWPMAHDVRPAEQALGVRQCKDCHTTDSPFFFGTIERDTPIKTEAGAEFVEAIQLQGLDRLYIWAFNASFVFRPFMKIVAFASCGVIALVLLAYMMKAVIAIARHSTDKGVA
jgi:hypothetical protein